MLHRKINITRLSLTVVAVLAVLGASAQIRLTLAQAVNMANDSSLTAFTNQNLFAAGYWQWRTYRADRLPSLSLNLTPARYNRSMTQRYDSEQNIDVFRAQRMYSASAGLMASQNVDFTGGTLYLESDLEYLHNFGHNADNQYSTVPVRIGYRQDLLGFNKFRWERRIEPLKYEKVKRELIYRMEGVSETVVSYFFALALAQTEYRLAQANLASADTMCVVGERRFRIAAIAQTDLLTLRLDKVNAQNALQNAAMSLKRARFALASYLGMPTDSQIDVVVPTLPAPMQIPLAQALDNARANSPNLMAERQKVLEAQRDVARTRIEKLFNASLNASVGFNQVAPDIGGAYRNLLRQDLVSVSVAIPIVDWGVRRGKHNIAVNNLNVAQLSAKQTELQVEQDVTMTISEFEAQQQLVASAVDAVDLADMAYAQTRQRFIIGKADINSLTLSNNRQQQANRNYIVALQNYWLAYYKIRKLTLYDFEAGAPISASFDRALGVD